MKLLFVTIISAAAAVSQPTMAQAWNVSLEKNALSGQSRRAAYSYARPPIGHIRFCKNFPGECMKRDPGNLRVRLTEDVRQQLIYINNSVNNAIKPMSDQEQYGEIERWTYPKTGRGDCEDYVLVKKKQLIQLGWPASALLITVVRDEYYEGHAILTVRTDRGDFILDNKRSEILAWDETNYFFIKRQSADDPRKWVSLIPQYPTPTVSAASGTNNAIGR